MATWPSNRTATGSFLAVAWLPREAVRGEMTPHMKHNCLLLSALGFATLSPLVAADLPPIPRFSTTYMDTTVPPGVDFARYAWGNWSKDNPLPVDKSRWSSFAQLDQYNQAGLRAILEAA